MFVFKSNYIASFKEYGMLLTFKNGILSGKFKREIEKDTDVINCKISIQKIEDNTIYCNFSIKFKNLKDGLKKWKEEFSFDWADLKEYYDSFQSNFKIFENEHILIDHTQKDDKTDFKLTEKGKYYYERF